MSQENKAPLVGYVVIDEYEEGMAHWSGAIAYPNPEGANLFWESPEPFIQKSAFDAAKDLCESFRVVNERLGREVAQRESEVAELKEQAYIDAERADKAEAERDKLAEENRKLKERLGDLLIEVDKAHFYDREVCEDSIAIARQALADTEAQPDNRDKEIQILRTAIVKAVNPYERHGDEETKWILNKALADADKLKGES